MIVTFISQCEKNALKKTRRVLDSFADRIGDNTWQTNITEEGLAAVKKQLRKTASKSTAVSCHRITTRHRTELEWIVGQRDAFDHNGRVPVHRTAKPIISRDESDWHYLPLIQALCAIAALLHDWGKATEVFQEKLQGKSPKEAKGDPIRHEWISCLLLRALINHCGTDSNEDESWLTALQTQSWNEQWFSGLSSHLANIDNRPLSTLPPAAKLVAWLIVSHHRLPTLRNEDAAHTKADRAESIDKVLNRIHQKWGYQNNIDDKKQLEKCFQFPHGFLHQSPRWQKALKKWSGKLIERLPLASECITNNSYRVILHHARLCLMLADHNYSSQAADKSWPDSTGLYANTEKSTKGRGHNTGKLKQKLDEHLVGVATQAIRNAYLLPAFETEIDAATGIRALKKRSPPAFAWQDSAVKKIAEWRKQNSDKRYGFFAVNMASTGKGKTFANAKIMRALSKDGDSLHYTLALGLRTLTLQTGDEYRHRIGLSDSDLAVLIGSKAVSELHQQKNQDNTESDDELEYGGSESAETLLDNHVDYDCDIPEEGLATILNTAKDRQFLYAPVLACTIDHLMAAVETKRGGRYILPSLRLMSSDLVIDEIDDFTGADLVAIARLVFLAGMLGRKVMISSATIPPDLAEGYFKTYREGWALFCKTRNAANKVGCAWMDEFNCKIETIFDMDDDTAWTYYKKHHADFVSKRVERLNKLPTKHMATIVNCSAVQQAKEDKQTLYFELIAKQALSLHEHHHSIDKKTGLKVSFGVVRMANIPPCIALTCYLLNYPFPQDTEVKAMAYHSQQVLLLRHLQEQHLDSVLRRKEQKEEIPAAFLNTDIRQHLDNSKKQTKNVVFILVATPVEEVGRDHDFDWAIVEPSSYRSIIQLAGRVLRHRDKTVTEPNIALLEYNWKGIENHKVNKEKKPAVFCRPGYETSDFKLNSHSLYDLLDTTQQNAKLNVAPRIQKPSDSKNFKPRDKLADLEHIQTKMLLTAPRDKPNKPFPSMQYYGAHTLNSYLWEHWHLTALPQTLAPFRKGVPTLTMYLIYDREANDVSFCEKDKYGEFIPRQEFCQIQKMLELDQSNLWLKRDYMNALTEQTERQQRSPYSASIRYGEINFIVYKGSDYCYEYSDQMGLVHKKGKKKPAE